MNEFKSASLALCLCCILAGTIKAVFPENNLKPVINSVLALYILASLLRNLSSASFDSFRSAVLRFPTQTAQAEDFSGYVQQSYSAGLTDAVQNELSQNGIAARIVQAADGKVEVWLQNASQAARAEELLDRLLPGGYVIAAGGADETAG